MKPFTICVATEQHLPYVEAVVSALEEVNRLTGNGVPFRDAYRAVGKAVEDGSFHFEGTLHHTHEGSVGKLCLEQIQGRFQAVLEGFPF